MKTSFKVLFFLKRSKLKKNGKMPIIARITVNGVKSEFSTKLEINPSIWSVPMGKATGRTEEAQEINSIIDDIKAKLNKTYHDMLRVDSVVTAEKVKNDFLGLSITLCKRSTTRLSYYPINSFKLPIFFWGFERIFLL